MSITPKPKTLVELFDGHPERWTKGANARNEFGGPCHPLSSTATCWCLAGSVSYIYGCGPELRQVMQKIGSVLNEVPGEYGPAGFNDYVATHSLIVELCRKAGV